MKEKLLLLPVCFMLAFCDGENAAEDVLEDQVPDVSETPGDVVEDVVEDVMEEEVEDAQEDEDGGGSDVQEEEAIECTILPEEVEGVQDIDFNIGPSSPSPDRMAFIDLSTGEIGLVLGDLTQWDIYFWFPVPMDGAANLNEGVGAVNLGNEVTFHEVAVAPDDSEYTEDTATSSEIGNTWHDGHGEGRLLVNGTIYAIKTHEGKYAKLEVLSAIAGTIEVRYFYQKDCSRNLATEE